MIIRFARNDDFPKMLEILTYYINNTAVLFAYNPPKLEDYKNMIKSVQENYPVLVAQKENEVIGYAYASKFHEGEAYDWTVETTIYISKDERNKKVGTHLYEKLEEILKNQNVITLNAYIAYTKDEDEYLDNSSKYFHEKMGFTQNARFKNLGYKFNKWYDSIWMTKQINDIENPPKTFISIKELERI